MRLARASLVALLVSRCAPAPSVSPTDDPPTAPAPHGAIAAGQPLDVGRPPEAAEPPLDPRILRTQRALVAREGRSFTRAFRDTTGLLRGASTVSQAVPVRAGRCYRIHVSAEAAVGDLGVRLLDAATLLEEDGSYGTYAVIGQRRPLCPEGDRVWRLELSAAGDTGRFVLSVLSRSSADEDPATGALRSSPW
jgi:hypothetical protein